MTSVCPVRSLPCSAVAVQLKSCITALITATSLSSTCLFPGVTKVLELGTSSQLGSWNYRFQVSTTTDVTSCIFCGACIAPIAPFLCGHTATECSGSHAPYLAMLAPMHVNLAIIMSLGAASTTAAAPRLPQRHCMTFSVRLTGTTTRTASGGVFDRRSGTLVRTSRPSPHVLWFSLPWRVRMCASMPSRGHGQPAAACFKACMLCAPYSQC
jgi:hypothetical protein